MCLGGFRKRQLFFVAIGFCLLLKTRKPAGVHALFPPVSNVVKIENSFFYTRCNLFAWCRYRGSQNYREITSDCCGCFANLVFSRPCKLHTFPVWM
uniref:Putative secreted protein n=1 Tax=Ixodes scapularis TaxID=6945 RepID=A0A4D5S538_IXOSC